MDSLKPPTFDWNSIRSIQGLSTLPQWHGELVQVPRYTSTKMVIPLNWSICSTFLCLIKWRKHKPVEPLRCNCRGMREEKKKSVKLFIEFLHSSMDHPASRWSRIYQFEDTRVKAGETLDEATTSQDISCVLYVHFHCQ